MENVCLIDLDGTLAGYEKQLLVDLEKMRSPGEPPIVIHHEDCPEWLENRMSVIKMVPGWWENLPVLEDGMRIFQEAKKIGFKCEVLTKGPRKSYPAWSEKLLWAQRHLGEDIDVTVTFNKGSYYGKVLVDDYPEYCLSWLGNRPRGIVVMPARKCNENFSHPRVIRYDGSDHSWLKVRLALIEAFNRTPKRIDD